MKRSIQILVITLVIAAIGYIAYSLIMSWHRQELETNRTLMQEELDTAKSLLQEERKVREKPAVPREKLTEAFGEEATEVPHEKGQTGFEEIDRLIMAFFSYLDGQEYVRAYRMEKGTYPQFLEVLERLSSNPPLVSGETESLHTLFRNMSHFYRAFGKDRIGLVKEILHNESEIIETVAGNLYLWFTISNGVNEQIKDRPSPEMLYDYSAYFLNTLAGRSYLLRRTPKVRILTTYYCVLILDRANDSLLNSNGIDIRPHIKMLVADIGNQTGFMYKEQYLSELDKLNEKYQL